MARPVLSNRRTRELALWCNWVAASLHQTKVVKMRSSFLCTVAATVLVIAVVTSSASAQEKRTIRFVTVSLGWNAALPFRVTLARGFFKQQGLQVEPILIRGG